MDDLIPLSKAASLFPLARTGKPIHRNTLRRYVTVGVRGVVLRSWRVGGRVMTSAEAVRDFIDECTARAKPAPKPPSKREMARRHKAVLEEAKRLIPDKRKP